MPIYNFNKPNFSEKVFNAIVNSTPQKKEIIVINDDFSKSGSKTPKDNTAKLVLKWVANIATLGLLFITAKALNFWASRKVEVKTASNENPAISQLGSSILGTANSTQNERGSSSSLNSTSNQEQPPPQSPPSQQQDPQASPSIQPPPQNPPIPQQDPAIGSFPNTQQSPQSPQASASVQPPPPQNPPSQQQDPTIGSFPSTQQSPQSPQANASVQPPPPPQNPPIPQQDPAIGSFPSTQQSPQSPANSSLSGFVNRLSDFGQTPGPILGNPIGSVIQEPPPQNLEDSLFVPASATRQNAPLQQMGQSLNFVKTLRAALYSINQVNLNALTKSETLQIGTKSNEIKEFVNNTQLMRVYRKKPSHQEINIELLKQLRQNSHLSKTFFNNYDHKNYTIQKINDSSIEVSSDNIKLKITFDNQGNIDQKSGSFKQGNQWRSIAHFTQGNFKLLSLGISQIVPPKEDVNAIKFEHEGVNYFTWYSEPDRIIIESQDSIKSGNQSNKIGLGLDSNGAISSVAINRENPRTVGNQDVEAIIPNEWKPIIKKGVEKSLIASSTYNQSYGQIDGKVVRSGLEVIPEFHLSKITKIIDSLYGSGRPLTSINMNIVFLLNTLQTANGIDAGGLARDLVCELSEALCKKFEFGIADESKMYYPKSTSPLSAETKELFRNLGKFFMFLNWTSQDVITGAIFDISLFKGALSLSFDEANTPFDQLKDDVKQKLLLAIYDSQTEELQKIKAHLKTYGTSDREYLELFYQANWTETDTQTARSYLEGVLLLDEEEEDDKDYFVDLQKGFRKAITEQPAFTKFLDQLEPVHAIAGGMTTFADRDQFQSKDTSSFYWEVNRAIDPKIMSVKVQGSLDRNKLRDYIIVDPLSVGVAKQKLEQARGWILEWIEDKNTSDENIRKALQNLTGSSGIVQNKKFELKSNSYQSVFMNIHTCFFYADISNDALQNLGKEDFMSQFLGSCVGDASYNTA